jgi:membrane protein required for colicin V production
MNWVDIIILIILAIGFFKGLGNGFVRGLFGLAALVLGVMVAAANSGQVTELVFSRLQIDPQGQALLGFLLVFVVVLIVVSVIGRVISKALKLAALGWLDRLAGAVLGLVISCMFVGVLLLLVVMAGLETNNGVARSTVAPTVITVMDAVVAFAPDAAREKIDEHYVKLRLEWERARKEAPKDEEEGEDGEAEEAVTFLDAALVPDTFTVARGSIGVTPCGA